MQRAVCQSTLFYRALGVGRDLRARRVSRDLSAGGWRDGGGGEEEKRREEQKDAFVLNAQSTCEPEGQRSSEVLLKAELVLVGGAGRLEEAELWELRVRSRPANASRRGFKLQALLLLLAPPLLLLLPPPAAGAHVWVDARLYSVHTRRVKGADASRGRCCAAASC